MKNLQKLLIEISQVTINIATNYPEIYKFLDESPLTIPSEIKPNIDKDALQEYLESLKELLKHHKETHIQTKNSINS